MAIASGSVAYTGTYTVDEATKTINANIETSTFANLVGAPNQRRIISSITADEMKFTNSTDACGGDAGVRVQAGQVTDEYDYWSKQFAALTL